jgi:hypothetical protein
MIWVNSLIPEEEKWPRLNARIVLRARKVSDAPVVSGLGFLYVKAKKEVGWITECSRQVRSH